MKRYSLLAAVVLIHGVALADSPATAPHAGQLERLKALSASGRHAEVVAVADHLLHELNSASSTGEWTFSFGDLEVTEAYLGTSVGYFHTQTHDTRDVLPAVPLKHQPDSAKRGDRLHYITAIDLKTGKAIWSRSYVLKPDFAIDPRDESLWIWGERQAWYAQLEPRTGEERRRGAIATTNRAYFQFACVRDGETEIWSRSSNGMPNPSRGGMYDLATGEYKENHAKPHARSGGISRIITGDNGTPQSTFTCSAAGQTLWQITLPAQVANPPIWAGRDVLILTGDLNSSAFLYCIDGEVGQTLWRTPLGAGAFIPRMVRGRYGASASGGWAPFGQVGEELFAIDATNRVHFFNRQTGEFVRRIELPGPPICPLVFGDDGSVTIVTPDSIRYLRNFTTGERPAVIGEIQVIRLRSLVAMGNPEMLRAGLHDAVSSARSSEDWQRIAEALESGGDPAAGVPARVREMIESGHRQSDALRRSHGLVAYLPTGPVSAPTLPIGTDILVADLDGFVRTISPLTAAEVESQPSEFPITRWHLQGNQLIAFGNGQSRVYREFVHPPELPPDDPMFLPRQPSRRQVDPRWNVRGSVEIAGPDVMINQRLVRPMQDGGVRELIDGKIVDRKGNFPALDNWQFVQIDGQWLATGEFGVYILDEELKPSAHLIRLTAGNNSPTPTIYRIAGDRDTIAITVREETRATLQVWSRDGKTLLSSVPVTEHFIGHKETGRLLRVAGGYLLSAGELVFVPDDPARPLWRFRIYFDVDTKVPWSYQSVAAFGSPRIVQNRLLVPAQQGGMFIFDFPPAAPKPAKD